jgi:hypothetical protein
METKFYEKILLRLLMFFIIYRQELPEKYYKNFQIIVKVWQILEILKTPRVNL